MNRAGGPSAVGTGGGGGQTGQDEALARPWGESADGRAGFIFLALFLGKGEIVS